MTTTTAATQANRTAGTIRRWCRTGVITATKVAGRWVIDAASLLRHIHPAKEAHMPITLNGSYTWTEADGYETTVTTKVRDRTWADGRVVSISGLAPLLADRIDAITDAGDRGHTLTVLAGAVIALREEPAQFSSIIHARMGGRVATTYVGTTDLPVDVVLDLGERLYGQLI